MSNHIHIVLHVDRHAAAGWGVEEVIDRWHSLFKGSSLSQRHQRGECLAVAELEDLKTQVDRWWQRLCDISWYMRCLNEPIARRANRDDNCTGRFWEGRFKSQALLDEKALAACLAYVDLNPVRAEMADSPEASEFTSVQRRIEHAKQNSGFSGTGLLAFVGNSRGNMPNGLPFRLTDYLELLDWTGRQIREDKSGVIGGHLPPILTRLEIDPKHWVFMAMHFESRFKSLVGTASPTGITRW